MKAGITYAGNCSMFISRIEDINTIPELLELMKKEFCSLIIEDKEENLEWLKNDTLFNDCDFIIRVYNANIE